MNDLAERTSPKSVKDILYIDIVLTESWFLHVEGRLQKGLLKEHMVGHLIGLS